MWVFCNVLSKLSTSVLFMSLPPQPVVENGLSASLRSTASPLSVIVLGFRARACSQTRATDTNDEDCAPGIRVAEYCPVINQWHLLLWPRGDLSACPHRQVDSAPRSCCGLREKTPLNFLQRVVEKLSNALREGGPKSQKGLPDPPVSACV